MSTATTSTAATRPALADVSTLRLGHLTSAAVARGKAWGVGTVLEGTETWADGTSVTARIVITAIGEQMVLARRVNVTDRGESSWVFDSRDWQEVQ